jgi:hypothetical protein
MMVEVGQRSCSLDDIDRKPLLKSDLMGARLKLQPEGGAQAPPSGRRIPGNRRQNKNPLIRHQQNKTYQQVTASLNLILYLHRQRLCTALNLVFCPFPVTLLFFLPSLRYHEPLQILI